MFDIISTRRAIPAATGLGDFNDDSSGDNDDYDYDVNGNLVKDGNKNISSISYNILNLPEQTCPPWRISVTGEGTITYLYDASGNKLSKTVNEGSSQEIPFSRRSVARLCSISRPVLHCYRSPWEPPMPMATYVGSKVFEGTTGSDLSFIGMEEGRFRPNSATAFTADYFLKDHLGNVRSMINENKALLEGTHYYPFGLTMKGISAQNATASLQNSHLY